MAAAWALTPTPTRPATEQTPEIPADAEATMQDPGNASILRCSDSAVAPDAATEHIAPASDWIGGRSIIRLSVIKVKQRGVEGSEGFWMYAAITHVDKQSFPFMMC